MTQSRQESFSERTLFKLFYILYINDGAFLFESQKEIETEAALKVAQAKNIELMQTVKELEDKLKG